MEFIEKVRTLCNERDTSVKQLEKDLGFSNGSLAKGVPRADRLFALAQYFDVPMEYFMDDSERLEYYYQKIRGQVIERFNEEAGKPLYRVAAGSGCYNSQYADEMVEADDGYEYATVCGDSMLPELRDGDTVKILRQTETTPHDYTLVKVDGEHATIKFVEIVENGVWLRALNKEVFEDKFFSIQEVMTLPVTIIGKVVSFERKL